jgi:hypothetical protein
MVLGFFLSSFAKCLTPEEQRTLRFLFEPSIDDPVVVVFDKGLAL